MKQLSEITLEKVAQMQSEIETVASQQEKRAEILCVYVNLVKETVSKNTSNEAFETILEELIERHNDLRVIASDKTDITASELVVANQFDKLFNLREVNAILEQVNVVTSSMTIHGITLQTEMASEIKTFCKEHSIDMTELQVYFPQYFTEYIN